MPCYILRAGDTAMVKIGWADQDVEERRKILQTGHWEDLTTLRVIEGGPWVERGMHRRFAAQRVKREWFTFHPDMLVFMPEAQPAKVAPFIRGDATLHCDLIRVVGGKAKIAKALSLAPSVLTKWHERGIPSKYWHHLTNFAASLPDPVAVSSADLARTKPKVAA